jgi:hypothetical protein
MNGDQVSEARRMRKPVSRPPPSGAWPLKDCRPEDRRARAGRHDEAMCEATSRGQARTASALRRKADDPRRLSDSGRGTTRVKSKRACRSERCAATATAREHLSGLRI